MPIAQGGQQRPRQDSRRCRDVAGASEEAPGQGEHLGDVHPLKRDLRERVGGRCDSARPARPRTSPPPYPRAVVVVRGSAARTTAARALGPAPPPAPLWPTLEPSVALLESRRALGHRVGEEARHRLAKLVELAATEPLATRSSASESGSLSGPSHTEMEVNFLAAASFAACHCSSVMF